jgi:hypothetical protein
LPPGKAQNPPACLIAGERLKNKSLKFKGDEASRLLSYLMKITLLALLNSFGVWNLAGYILNIFI